MTNRVATFGVLAGMAFGGGAFAQPVDGPYVGVGAGVNGAQPFSQQQTLPFRGPKGKVDENVGFVGLASVGYGFGNGFRAEVEGNIRENHYQKLRLPGQTPQSVSGFVQTFGGMVNAFFDFDIGSPYIFPYVGAGAGYAITDYSSNQERGRYAVQGIAGSSFPFPGVPGLSVTAEYRFFAQPGTAKNNNALSGQPLEQFKRGQRFDHSGLIGLRYAFDVPEPPPPPVAEQPPAVSPARSYLVFFDWDRATLTSRARQIVKEAADNSTHVQYTKIEVNGYTDTSGTPKYNQGLSVRRADNVAAELVRDGVPRNAIAIQGFGETRLLVQTAKGVREPQNRRVEIIIR